MVWWLNRRRWIRLSFLLLAIPVMASANPLQQDAGADGLLVMEAENNDGNLPQGSNSWTSVTSPAGFSGSNAYQALPSNTPKVGTGFGTGSPRLDFQVNFVKTGTHYVWVLGRGDASSSNSIHVGIDGVELPATDQTLHYQPPGSGWVWSSFRNTGIAATVEVATAGVHTFNIWMRESGVYVDRVLLTTNPGYVPTGLEAESSRGASASIFEDNFNDGDALGWTVVSNCQKGAANWQWVANSLMQIDDCRGFSPEGVAVASHAVNGVALPANVDIRLKVRSEDPALDSVVSNDSSIWKFDTIGLLFGYQDANNYYRFDLDGNQGHRKLWRVQAGTFTELATSPQSFVGGQWVDIRVLHQNGVIAAFVDNQPVFAVEDATFASGYLALFCARNASCSFDDIVVTGATVQPSIGLAVVDGPAHVAGEYFVDGDGVLDLAAYTTDATGVGGVEFVVDEGTGAALSQSDFAAPYTSQFTLATGEHTVSAYLLDGGLVRLGMPEAGMTLPGIGTGGIHLAILGDSITNGIFDDEPADSISMDLRNTGTGYAQLLNDYLSADNGRPVTVMNEGNAGEASWEGASRVGAVLARSPEVQALLVSYGANDSGGSMPTPSGLDLVPGDPGYAGSFKDNIQQIIDAAASAGKSVLLARAPPYMANASRDASIVQYNLVIDQLIAENAMSQLPPDFYAYFNANPAEFSPDGIHPNGAGYQSMALLWCDSLNGRLGLSCIDADADGLTNLFENSIGTDLFVTDTDSDGLTDYQEIAFDGDDTSYIPGIDPDPLLDDTDSDGLLDGVDPIPLDFNFADGDLAPLGAPDGQVNAGDYLIALRIALGELTATSQELAHGDLYPPGAPDGKINLQDIILLQAQ